MTKGPSFVLDTNILIEAYRRYYAFDINPGFWDCLIEHAKNGRVESIDRVKDELTKGKKDELSAWTTGHFSGFFASTDDSDVIQYYREMVRWVNQNPQYTDAAKAEFADVENADGWLVAYAKAKGRIVVTREQPSPHAKKRVPIPSVCREFAVPYVDTWDMLRRLGVEFDQR